jgi:hypothetical protein
MKKKQIETLLYSVAGVGAMFLIVVALNFILGAFKTRLDLTQEKAYTLSAGTRAILKKLESPVEIRFYCTQGEKEMPPQFKTYAQHVEDLLAEYRQRGRGNVEIKKLNPRDSTASKASCFPTGRTFTSVWPSAISTKRWPSRFSRRRRKSSWNTTSPAPSRAWRTPKSRSSE